MSDFIVRHAVGFLLLGAGLVAASPVVGQERSFIRFDDGVLKIEGPIRPLADQVFVNEFASAMLATPYPKPVRIRLNSDGGGFEASKTIVQGIRAARREGTTVIAEVPSGGRCMSACLLIFSAADQRLAAPDAVFLFHGIVYTGLEPEPARKAEIERERGEVAKEYLAMISASDSRLGRFLASNRIIDQDIEIAFSGADMHQAFPEFVTGLLAP